MNFASSRRKFRKRPQLVADVASLGMFLRTLYPHDTAMHVADDVGASTRTVENWLGGLAAPRLDHFVRLVDLYGPGVIAAAHPSAPRWLDDAVEAERIRSTEAEIGRLRATLGPR